MNPELDARLCKDFPLIFQNRYGDMRETAMCWGFECGSGWFSLIESLCTALMRPVDILEAQLAALERVKTGTEDWQIEAVKKHPDDYSDEAVIVLKSKIKEAKAHVPVASQVKQKYGGLRFYVRGATNDDYAKISFAEALSYKICEHCGRFDDEVLCYSAGWVSTLCPEHADKQYDPEWAKAYRQFYMPYKRGEYNYDTFSNKLGEWEEEQEKSKKPT